MYYSLRGSPFSKSPMLLHVMCEVSSVVEAFIRVRFLYRTCKFRLIVERSRILQCHRRFYPRHNSPRVHLSKYFILNVVLENT